MTTDRDVVLRCAAASRYPCSTRVSEFAGGTVVAIGTDGPVDDALYFMSEHGVFRLPIIDGCPTRRHGEPG